MLEKFLDFGKMGARRIVEYLFWGGALLSAASSLILGKYIYMTTTYNKGITYFQNGQKWYTEKQVNNLPLGIGGAIASFIISIIFWKLACEILFLIIRCMEKYLEKP